MSNQITIGKNYVKPTAMSGASGWDASILVKYAADTQSYSTRTKERDEELQCFLVEFAKDVSVLLRSSVQHVRLLPETKLATTLGLRMPHLIQVVHLKKKTVMSHQHQVFLALSQTLDRKWNRRPHGNIWYWPRARDILLQEMDAAIADVAGGNT